MPLDLVKNRAACPAPRSGTSIASIASTTDLLRGLIQIPSISGRESSLVDFVADWAMSHGLVIDRWQSEEVELAKRYDVPVRHIPLAGRPTLVVKLPRNSAVHPQAGRSVIFNAHADVVSAPLADRWKADPWAGDVIDDRMIGRGACDVKGPLAAALQAMVAISAAHPEGLPGDVLLEVIPGEEDCVGLGTLTSVARGYTADACVVLEPTDLLPRSASRGGLRFEITSLGKAVHGTVKWLGRDAIKLSRRILDVLDTLESRWNDRAADELFATVPFARPITVDTIRGGEWQGMTCDHCTIAGYLELLPGDDLSEWSTKLEKSVREGVGQNEATDIVLQFSETYVGHRLAPESSLCGIAEFVAKSNNVVNWTGWEAFNSGCEAGLRASLLGTPTLVWGPGSLTEAHAVDESIALDDVARAARMFEQFILAWSSGRAV